MSVRRAGRAPAGPSAGFFWGHVHERREALSRHVERNHGRRRGHRRGPQHVQQKRDLSREVSGTQAPNMPLPRTNVGRALHEDIEVVAGLPFPEHDLALRNSTCSAIEAIRASSAWEQAWKSGTREMSRNFSSRRTITGCSLRRFVRIPTLSECGVQSSPPEPEPCSSRNPSPRNPRPPPRRHWSPEPGPKTCAAAPSHHPGAGRRGESHRL